MRNVFGHSRFEKIARAMSRDYNVSVQFSGIAPCTVQNGASTTIYLPANADEIPGHCQDSLEGWLDHEVVCLENEKVARETGDAPPSAFQARAARMGKEVQLLHNVFEGVRGELRVAEAYPGVADNLRRCNERTVATYTSRTRDFWRDVGAYIVCETRGLSTAWAEPELVSLASYFQDVIADASLGGHSPEQAFNFAVEVVNRIKDLAEKAEQQAEEQNGSEDNEDGSEDNEDTDGSEDNEDSDGSEGDEDSDGSEDNEDTDGSEDNEDGSEDNEDGSEGNEDGSEDNEDGSEGDEDSDGSEDGSEGDEDSDGSEGDEDGSEGDEDGSEGDEDGSEGDEDGSEDGSEGSEGDEDDLDEGSDGSKSAQGGASGGAESDGADGDAEEGNSCDGDSAASGAGASAVADGPAAEDGTEDAEGTDVGEVPARSGDLVALADMLSQVSDEPAETDFIRAMTKDIVAASKRDVAENRRCVAPPEVVAEDGFTETPHSDDIRVRHYERVKQEVNDQISALKRKLSAVLHARTQVHWIGDKEEGELDAAALSQLRHGEHRVFAQKTRAQKVDTRVTLLVDLSGSMGPCVDSHMQALQDRAAQLSEQMAKNEEGLNSPNVSVRARATVNAKEVKAKLDEVLKSIETRATSRGSRSCAYYAQRTAIALVETLAAINIPCEVLGFYNAGGPELWYADSVRKWTESTGCTRWRPYKIVPFKKFDEPLKKCRGRFVEMSGRGDNGDGDALRFAARRLAGHSEPRKMLVVISDGRPDGPGVRSVLAADLHRAIQDITKAGIEVHGVGANSRAVEEFYTEANGATHTVITDLSQMALSLVKMLRTKLTQKAA